MTKSRTTCFDPIHWLGLPPDHCLMKGRWPARRRQMWRVLMLGLAFVFTSAGIANAEWVKATSGVPPYYVDTKSIKKSSGQVEAAILINSVHSPKSKYASALSKVVINCANKTLKYEGVTVYSQQMGGGDILDVSQRVETVNFGAERNGNGMSDDNLIAIRELSSFICKAAN
jgi:hypothetical protein